MTRMVSSPAALRAVSMRVDRVVERRVIARRSAAARSSALRPTLAAMSVRSLTTGIRSCLSVARLQSITSRQTVEWISGASSRSESSSATASAPGSQAMCMSRCCGVRPRSPYSSGMRLLAWSQTRTNGDCAIAIDGQDRRQIDRPVCALWSVTIGAPAPGARRPRSGPAPARFPDRRAVEWLFTDELSNSGIALETSAARRSAMWSD